MSTECTPPTSEQRRLVNIGMFIQFYLAAVGHLVVWLLVLYDWNQPHPEGWEGDVVYEVMVYAGIPISFGILVAVYILFRCLLAYASFGSALTAVIAIDVLHALIMCFTIITPARLIIPIVLYSFALRSYMKDNASQEHNEVERPDSTRSTD